MLRSSFPHLPTDCDHVSTQALTIKEWCYITSGGQKTMNGRSQGMTFWRPFCPSICSTAGSESLHLVTLHFGGSRASVGGICPALRASLAGRPAGVPRRLGFSLAGAGAGDSLAGRLSSAPPRRPSPRGRPPRLPPPKGPHLPSRPSPAPLLSPAAPCGTFPPRGRRLRGQRSGDGGRRAPPRAPAQPRP